jgi:hypothetical protein
MGPEVNSIEDNAEPAMIISKAEFDLLDQIATVAGGLYLSPSVSADYGIVSMAQLNKLRRLIDARRALKK